MTQPQPSLLNVDPLVGMTRLAYQYVGNNPLNATDPAGLVGGVGLVACDPVCQTGSPTNHQSFVCATPDPYLASSTGPVVDCSGGTLATGSVRPGSSADEARAAAAASGYEIPDNYVAERAANDQGWVFRAPGSTGNANIVRVGEPNAQNPTGYVRYYNSFGQAITGPSPGGKPGSDPDTHLPLRGGDDPEFVDPFLEVSGGCNPGQLV